MGHEILFFVAIMAVWLLISYLRVRAFREKKIDEPLQTVRAIYVSKKVKPGTYRAGRSIMGFSFFVSFVTEDDELLELVANQEEFGSMWEGKEGMLTYQGKYFVSFEIDESCSRT